MRNLIFITVAFVVGTAGCFPHYPTVEEWHASQRTKCEKSGKNVGVPSHWDSMSGKCWIVSPNGTLVEAW